MQMANALLADGFTVAAAAKEIGVGVSSLYRARGAAAATA